GGGGAAEGRGGGGVVGVGVVGGVAAGGGLGARGRWVPVGWAGCHPPVPLADAQPAGEVVHPERAAQRAGQAATDDAVPGEHRDQEGQDPNEVRSVAQGDLALGQPLVDEADLALLQVSEPTVPELRARRRRARGEIVPLDQGGAQAPGRGVERHAGAGDPAPDHEHVELLGGEAVERAGPPEGRRPQRRLHRTEATAGPQERLSPDVGFRPSCGTVAALCPGPCSPPPTPPACPRAGGCTPTRRARRSCSCTGSRRRPTTPTSVTWRRCCTPTASTSSATTRAATARPKVTRRWATSSATTSPPPSTPRATAAIVSCS